MRNDELEAFRSALWEFEPEHDEPTGFDRVGWLQALMADVHAWIANGTIDVADHPDPSAFMECLREVDTLASRLRSAMNEHPIRKASHDATA